MSARWMSLGVWALVAAAAVGWGLRLFVTPAPVPAGALLAEVVPPPQADLTRLLGADPVPVAPVADAAPPPDARFTLVGVVAPRPGAAGAREGVALIAVDGGPARAYRVGAAVDGDTVLQSVNGRGAALGPRGGPTQVALQLPPPPAAAAGVMPSLSPGPRVPMPSAMPPLMRPAPAPRPAMPPGMANPPEELTPTQPDAGPQRPNGPTLM